MRHFVITRFSIIFPDWRESRLLVDEERRRWFEYRANMFQETLLKSVIDQTRPVEKLFLLMDSGDVDLYESYLHGNSNVIQPVFTKLSDMNSEIDKFLSSNEGHAISVSRVDSDDVLACDYMERKFALYKEHRERRGLVHIVATHGYRSDLRHIQSVVDFTPPFISVFYDQYTGHLSLGGNHLEVSKLAPLQCREAAWLQLLHNSNVGNLFATKKIEKINNSNWPQKIHRPDSDVIKGYVLNNEAKRSLKRQIYAIILRTEWGVRALKFLKRFSR